LPCPGLYIFVNMSRYPANYHWMQPSCRTPLDQARRESNPQPSVLETDALPIELLAYTSQERPKPYFRLSLWTVCFRSCLQNFFSSSFGAPSATLTFVL
jgi:hypothetical protein